MLSQKRWVVLLMMTPALFPVLPKNTHIDRQADIYSKIRNKLYIFLNLS